MYSTISKGVISEDVLNGGAHETKPSGLRLARRREIVSRLRAGSICQRARIHSQMVNLRVYTRSRTCARKYGEVALVALSSGRGQGRIRPHRVVIIASLRRRRVGRRGRIVIVVEREREREHRRSRVVERARAHRCQAEAEGEGDRESTALSSLSSLERV